MASIVNHYSLLEAVLAARASGLVDFLIEPPRSSLASLAARPESQDKKDRMWSVQGKSRPMELDDEELAQIIVLWRTHYPAFDAFCRKFDAAMHRRDRARRDQFPMDWRPRHAGILSAEENMFRSLARRWNYLHDFVVLTH